MFSCCTAKYELPADEEDTHPPIELDAINFKSIKSIQQYEMQNDLRDSSGNLNQDNE